MVGGRQFRFRPALTLAAAPVFAILCVLGVWQLKRLEWKTTLIAQVETRVDDPPIDFDEAVRRAGVGEYMEYAPVTVTGRIVPAESEAVFGAREGEAGAFIFVPLEREDGERVYINQGFVPQGQPYAGAGDTGSVVTAVGLFRYRERPAPPASWVLATGKSVDGLWVIRDPLAFARAGGAAASPYYVDQFAAPGRAFPIGGLTRLEFRNNHLDYALTWFGLAATLVAIWFAASLKTPQN